ncbi:MAG: LysR family transcriptional regulator substrate-binding protein, partial [Desulfobacteraceae bacterium]
EFSSINSLRKCLKRGIGITICPEVAVDEELASGDLVKLKWDSPDKETPVIMIWHAEKWCSPLLKRFMSLCEEIITD